MFLFVLVISFSLPLFADPLQCKLNDYHAGDGLNATVQHDSLVVTWTGDSNSEVRSRFGIDHGQPIIQELAVRKGSGSWTVLGRNLTPEYQVTSGVRRISEQQLDPLRQMGIQITEAVIEKNRWFTFWDAPLEVPGIFSRDQRPLNVGLPRSENEIRRANSSFHTDSCEVKTNGDRLEITFPGLEMGIFSGSLRFTVFRNSGLLRMEAIAKTDEPWVAYKYQAGLNGFSTAIIPEAIWHDVGGHAQRQLFAGAKNDGAATVRAANRLLVAAGDSGSVAVFPPPHTFFFTREVETNLGYVWYRNDGAQHFAVGIRQPEHEDIPEYRGNFALYNAPPGTWQRMAVYFYITAQPGEDTRERALRFTRKDTLKALPGYKIFANHFHIGFTDRLMASGSLDTPLPDLAAMKALGLNIIGLSDFHEGDSPLQHDPGPERFRYEKAYFEGSRRASDTDFLVLPWEEPDVYFGGHYNVLWPKAVYWAKVRPQGVPLVQQDPIYGKTYHIGSIADLDEMLQTEHAYWYTAHPRTKGSTGYPDAVLDKPFLRDDRYLGEAFKPGMGMDLSENRLCDWRCFGSLDTVNNSIVNSGLRPRVMIADVDTYRKGPEDDLYANFPVNYLQLDHLPGPDDDWSPVEDALRDGNFFVTTGEILIPNYSWSGTGTNKKLVVELEWTFPLEFLELVWGDGAKVERQIISATDLPAFGRKRLELPFGAAGKSWIRFAVWDSAGNGAFLQPVWVNSIK
jgi:hypothetical protein